VSKSKNPKRKQSRNVGTVYLKSIPVKLRGNEKLQTKGVQKFVEKNVEGSTRNYKLKMFNYLNVYTQKLGVTEGIKKAQREVEFKRENRIKLIKKTKAGKVWRDNKTGEKIMGTPVRKIVFKSIHIKTVETLQAKSRGRGKLKSFDEAESKYNEMLDKKYRQILKKKTFKTQIAKWKNEGLSKRQIAEKVERVAKGKAELFLIRTINKS